MIQASYCFITVFLNFVTDAGLLGLNLLKTILLYNQLSLLSRDNYTGMSLGLVRYAVESKVSVYLVFIYLF